jgi:hypothetical protein
VSVVVKGPDLRQAIDLVKHGLPAGRNYSPGFAALGLHGDANGFRLVASDNYRIAVAEIEVSDGDPEAFGFQGIHSEDVGFLMQLLLGKSRYVRQSPVTIAHINEPDDPLQHVEFASSRGTLRLAALEGIERIAKYAEATARLTPQIDSPTALVNGKYLGMRVPHSATTRIYLPKFKQPISGETGTAIFLYCADLGYREYIMPLRLADGTSEWKPE